MTAARSALISDERTTAVIGGGIVGLSTATYLRRAGRRVTVYDAGGPGAGASYGNAGLISPDSCLPVAMPGALANLPRWLTDPEGPLVIDKARLPRSASWLLKLLRSSSRPAVKRTASAMRALHSGAFETYRDMLSPEDFSDLIRLTGHVQIWDESSETSIDPFIAEIWRENGIKADPLNADELRQLIPELAPDVRSGLFLPNNGMTVNPFRLVGTVHGRFMAAGGEFAAERVMKIVPEGGALRVISNHDDRRFDEVVVAAGAWSHQLLAPLGIRPPLDTERGYHVMVEAPGVDIRVPILHKGRGFGASPMEHGLRFAGTVEIAGLNKPPNERRAGIILEQAKRLFPKLDTSGAKMWMGFRPSMPDSLPVIDAAKRFPGLYLAFGHSHFGMTSGPVTGRAIAALITGETPHIDLSRYSIDRF